MLSKSPEKGSLVFHKRKDAVSTSPWVQSLLGEVSQSQCFISLLFLGQHTPSNAQGTTELLEKITILNCTNIGVWGWFFFFCMVRSDVGKRRG